jgi:hypothetical protein
VDAQQVLWPLSSSTHDDDPRPSEHEQERMGLTYRISINEMVVDGSVRQSKGHGKMTVAVKTMISQPALAHIAFGIK